VGASLLLAAALLAVFLWRVDLRAVGREMAKADPRWVTLSVGLALASYWLRAVRWGLILRPVGRVRHSGLILATAAGYAAMTLLPARMGDVVRPLLLARRERMPVSAALASVLTERVVDLWTVMVFFVAFLLDPPPLELDATAAGHLRTLTVTGWVVAAGLVLATLALLLLFRLQERFIAVVTAPLGRLGRGIREAVARFLGHFLDGLRVIQRPRDLAAVAGVSLLVWWLIYWQLDAVLRAFGMAEPLRVSYLLVTLSILGLAVPTPGGVGGFHAMIQLGLTTFLGVGLERATGLAIVHHAVSFLPITVVGLACLPAFSVSLGEAARLARGRSGGGM